MRLLRAFKRQRHSCASGRRRLGCPCALSLASGSRAMRCGEIVNFGCPIFPWFLSGGQRVMAVVALAARDAGMSSPLALRTVRNRQQRRLFPKV